MSNFTPGKWETCTIFDDHQEAGLESEHLVFADNQLVADCFGNEDNARLIAAAPEMYSLLDSTHRILYRFKTERIIDVVDLANLVKETALLLKRIDGK